MDQSRWVGSSVGVIASRAPLFLVPGGRMGMSSGQCAPAYAALQVGLRARVQGCDPGSEEGQRLFRALHLVQQYAKTTSGTPAEVAELKAKVHRVIVQGVGGGMGTRSGTAMTQRVHSPSAMSGRASPFKKVEASVRESLRASPSGLRAPAASPTQTMRKWRGAGSTGMAKVGEKKRGYKAPPVKFASDRTLPPTVGSKNVEEDLDPSVFGVTWAPKAYGVHGLDPTLPAHLLEKMGKRMSERSNHDMVRVMSDVAQLEEDRKERARKEAARRDRATAALDRQRSEQRAAREEEMRREYEYGQSVKRIDAEDLAEMDRTAAERKEMLQGVFKEQMANLELQRRAKAIEKERKRVEEEADLARAKRELEKMQMERMENVRRAAAENEKTRRANEVELARKEERRIAEQEEDVALQRRYVAMLDAQEAQRKAEWQAKQDLMKARLDKMKEVKNNEDELQARALAKALREQEAHERAQDEDLARREANRRASNLAMRRKLDEQCAEKEEEMRKTRAADRAYAQELTRDTLAGIAKDKAAQQARRDKNIRTQEEVLLQRGAQAEAKFLEQAGLVEDRTVKYQGSARQFMSSAGEYGMVPGRDDKL